MVTSTDAILCFGYLLDTDDGDSFSSLPFAQEGEEDFEDVLQRIYGCREYPEGGWLDDLSAAREQAGVTLVYHCSYDYPMYCLAASGTEITAHRGYPQLLERLPEVSASKIQKLRTFAGQYGIEGEPRWILCSMWG